MKKNMVKIELLEELCGFIREWELNHGHDFPDTMQGMLEKADEIWNKANTTKAGKPLSCRFWSERLGCQNKKVLGDSTDCPYGYDSTIIGECRFVAHIWPRNGVRPTKGEEQKEGV